MRGVARVPRAGFHPIFAWGCFAIFVQDPACTAEGALSRVRNTNHPSVCPVPLKKIFLLAAGPTRIYIIASRPTRRAFCGRRGTLGRVAVDATARGAGDVVFGQAV
jgi:hypothetical protein